MAPGCLAVGPGWGRPGAQALCSVLCCCCPVYLCNSEAQQRPRGPPPLLSRCDCPSLPFMSACPVLPAAPYKTLLSLITHASLPPCPLPAVAPPRKATACQCGIVSVYYRHVGGYIRRCTYAWMRRKMEIRYSSRIPCIKIAQFCYMPYFIRLARCWLSCYKSSAELLILRPSKTPVSQTQPTDLKQGLTTSQRVATGVTACSHTQA